MRKFIFLITNRLTIIALFLLIQITVLIYFNFVFYDQWYYMHAASMVVGLIVCLFIISEQSNPSFKIIWIITILTLPLFGVLFYLYARTEKLRNSKSQRMNYLQELREKELDKIESTLDKDLINQQRYLLNHKYPLYKNTISKFLKNGELKLSMLLHELKKAEHFIFMEYFIITKSKMWDEILSVLIEKQKAGVEIRIIYDDLGSSTKLPYTYHKTLTKLGFKVIRFNPMRLRFRYVMNYRDHRKIVVIDNKVAFTGGFNIGDEYTNKKSTLGYWHDAGIMIKGSAVWTFTCLFLENFSYANKREPLDFDKYNLKPDEVINDALYCPFGDIPTDNSLVAKNVYIHLITDAKEKIYITAPYLILDNEMMSALKLAASSGVEVNIIIPNIPDKKIVYMISESYVDELVKNGINIFKFIPGFIHSKMIISDNKVAMIGSSNLDFRSLYFHLEANLWLNDKKTIKEMQRYFEITLSVSKKITLENIRKRSILTRILRIIFRLFAPLL